MFALTNRRRFTYRSRGLYLTRPELEILERRLALSAVTSPVVHVAQGHSATLLESIVAKTKVYTVASVTSFQQLDGNFAQDNMAKARGLELYLSSQGHVGNVVIPDTFYGTISGRLTGVKGHSNYVKFNALKSYGSEVGATYSYTQIVIELNNARLPIAMAIESKSGNDLSAIVNNTGFSSAVSNGYIADVKLH